MASGIASSSHLQEVWATLEHLGRTRVLRTACTSPDYQVGRAAWDLETVVQALRASVRSLELCG